MRLVIIFTTVLVLNIIYPGKVNEQLNDTIHFISFLLMTIYAAHHDMREREYWAAIVKKVKNNAED